MARMIIIPLPPEYNYEDDNVYTKEDAIIEWILKAGKIRNVPYKHSMEISGKKAIYHAGRLYILIPEAK